MKFKVGDRVRVTEKAIKHGFWSEKMREWLGKTMTIRATRYDYYKMEEDKYINKNSSPGWDWFEGMIELVKQGRQKKDKPMKYILMVDKNYILLKTRDDLKASIKENRKICSEAYLKVYELGSELSITTKISLRKKKGQ